MLVVSLEGTYELEQDGRGRTVERPYRLPSTVSVLPERRCSRLAPDTASYPEVGRGSAA